ncbi:MAG: phospholipase D-like domain-containing protein [Smithella sp.]|jgi:hypothetical protein
MLKVVSANLWPKIRRKAAVSKSKRVAIAYVTDAELLPLQSGDLLVTDASDAAIAGGRSSAAVLANYLELGVALFSLDNIHAKVAILDDWAVIGSANASQNSATYYVEAAVITDRPDIVGQADKFVLSLAKSSTPINKPFIDRISAIPVVRPAGEPKRLLRRKQLPPLSEQRFWFLGIPDDEPYHGDTNKVDAVADELKKELSEKSGSIEWFWCNTSERFCKMACVGDIVIDCWRPHAQTRSTKQVKVYRHARIAKIFQEDDVKAKVFLCIWPPKSEKSALPWESFLKLAHLAGIKRRLTPKSFVELTARQSSALYELWDS